MTVAAQEAHHNYKGTPSHLWKREWIPGHQIHLDRPNAVTRKGARHDKDRGVPIKTGEDSLVRTREEPSGTLRLERSPSAANRDEAPEVNQMSPTHNYGRAIT